MFVCVLQAAHSQKIAREDFQEEVKMVISILKDVHPYPYAFQTEERFNFIKDSILQGYNSQDSISVLDAFQCYANLTGILKCGHTGVYRTKELDGVINKFPMDIKVIDGVGLITHNNPSMNLSIGDQIISVNDISWKAIFEKGIKLHSSDGDSPLNHALFERSLRLDIAIILGNPQNYKLTTMHKGTIVENILSSNVSAILAPTFQGFEFSRVGTNKNIGLIKVFNFPSDEKSIRDFEKFCKKTSSMLKRKKIKTVIIDIRNNGGGDRIDLLLRYFTPTSFKLMSSKINTFGLAKHSKDLIFHGTTYENVLKIPTKSEASRQVDFQGDLYLDINLYVLVNGRTASAASHFASLVKEHDLGKIAGTETGGRAAGCNGNVYCSYFLSNSGIELYLPLMVNTYAVNQEDNPNHGVIPDIFIDEELTDDLELKKLIDFILNEYQ